MSIKAYFKGRSGSFFWINIVLMGLVLIAVPMGIFYALGVYTHHGEKIEVPEVIGMSVEHATTKLENADLRVLVADSAYDATKRPGIVIEQTPRFGSEVKSGRIIYLTINCGEKMIPLPNIIDNSSLRTAEAQLKALGFSLTPPERVDGENRDWVVGVKQGMRSIYNGDLISKAKALTIVVQAGLSDSLEVDSDYVDVSDLEYYE